MKLRPALGLALALSAGCAPAAVDYSALHSAADARQQRLTGATPSTASAEALLRQPLTAETAARVALLNNRGVRAEVEELGIAEARLAQVRRLPNPSVEAQMLFQGDERPELEVGAMLDLTDLLLLAWRSAAANAEVDAAKTAALGAVIDLSYDARRAFYVYQAAAELVELRRTVLQAFNASAELAARLHAAGNITDLDLTRQMTLFEEARFELQQAERARASARERVNVLLGLWGRGIAWKAVTELPELPETELAAAKLESEAVARSLDLALAKQRFGAAAKRANVAQVAGFLPELKAGVTAERSEEWGIGPALELELPLFYQGQGEVGVAKAEMRQQQNAYTHTAVTLRARAREVAATLALQRRAVEYYASTLLPLRQRALEQTQLEYNAMLVGLFELLQAKRDQVQTSVAYVEQLRDYWLARTDAEQLLAGRLPGEGAAGSGASAKPPAAADDDH